MLHCATRFVKHNLLLVTLTGAMQLGLDIMQGQRWYICRLLRVQIYDLSKCCSNLSI